MKRWLLKLHRWAALLFALPLACVIVSGLVLSVEPWVAAGAVVPGSLSAERVIALLARHDAGGRARAIAYRTYDGTLTVGAGRGGGTLIDVASGEIRPAPSASAELFGTTRRFHETLLINASWLVIGSTGVMLALIAIGVLMGVPRLANTLAGWHKAMAWGLLPLLVLSPLTALLMAGGITFAGAAPAVVAPPPRLVDAVRLVAREHDLSALVWLRPRGDRMLARLIEDGEYRVYQVTDTGVVPVPRNWPRLWHEGNFAGRWSSTMNVVVSVGLIGLLGSGVWLWARRWLRRGTRVKAAPA